MRRVRGFTLVELVAVIVMVGILAAVAVPRMDTSGFRAVSFHNRVLAALRYAQKTAASHRRLVCVTFPDTLTVAFQIDTDKNGTCDTALTVPGSNGSQVASDDASVAFAPLPAALNFAADGSGPDRTINISGAASITVVGVTGNVF